MVLKFDQTDYTTSLGQEHMDRDVQSIYLKDMELLELYAKLSLLIWKIREKD